MEEKRISIASRTRAQVKRGEKVVDPTNEQKLIIELGE
jgi:hypothetical protein